MWVVKLLFKLSTNKSKGKCTVDSRAKQVSSKCRRSHVGYKHTDHQVNESQLEANAKRITGKRVQTIHDWFCFLFLDLLLKQRCFLFSFFHSISSIFCWLRNTVFIRNIRREVPSKILGAKYACLKPRRSLQRFSLSFVAKID